MSFNKIEIGARLKEFGDGNFKNFSRFAEALGMKAQSLYVYINGKSSPGAEIISKLLDLGCDINWLLTGRTDANKGYVSNNNIDMRNGNVVGSMEGNAKTEINNNNNDSLKTENEFLKKEIESLREQIKTKDKLIQLLETK